MTKMYNINEQKGRSMVEMLGVLAIVGVLSIGGIAGYSKAMAKYKINKTMDQISLIVTNIRTAFGNQQSYKGLNVTRAIAYELVGNDLTLGETTKLTNAFNGEVTIEAGKSDGTSCGSDEGLTTYCPTFILTYKGLDQATCGAIASADWGGTASSGLYKMTIKGGDKSYSHTWTKTAVSERLPIEYFEAMNECVEVRTGKSNEITWVYF